MSMKFTYIIYSTFLSLRGTSVTVVHTGLEICNKLYDNPFILSHWKTKYIIVYKAH